MNAIILRGALIGTAAAVAACSPLPDRVDTLEQARTTVRMLEQDPLAQEAAARELAAARDAIESADRAYEDKMPLEIVEHRAYVAERHARISEQRIAEAHAREELEQGEAERNRVLLEAREREAERNRELAAQNRELAEASRDEAQRNLALAEQSREEAERAQDLAAQERATAATLEEELAALQAEQTERGLVLTLSDVLFDTNESSLKAGAQITIDRLAAFLNEYPERRVLIEGHTDARGPDEYNIDLSERRAGAVRDALMNVGIDPNRIQTNGLGESYPIASNETMAGMQENRRVEIVISDEEGEFPGAAQRTASAAGRPGA